MNHQGHTANLYNLAVFLCGQPYMIINLNIVIYLYGNLFIINFSWHFDNYFFEQLLYKDILKRAWKHKLKNCNRYEAHKQKTRKSGHQREVFIGILFLTIYFSYTLLFTNDRVWQMFSVTSAPLSTLINRREDVSHWMHFFCHLKIGWLCI